MERYLFFNSELVDGVYDREYQAQDFATYFGSVLSTGLLHTDKIPGMSVSVESGTLNTVISPGKAIMKGHLYENTTPLTLEHSIPEPDLDRIDRVVLRLNLNNAVRDIKLRVLEGEPSENPIAPELTRTDFIHDISLAQIRVRKNTVQLLASDLVDERMIEDLCGIVHSLISVPTTVFQQQFNTWFDDYKDSHGNDFQDWFDELQVILDENVAANLLNLINEHKSINTTDAHLAKNIGLEDINDNFTAENVEGAMNELFTNVSDGKLLVGTAITDVDDSLVVPENPTFQNLADLIDSISTGKKWASGESDLSPDKNEDFYLVNDKKFSFFSFSSNELDFKPSIIIASLIHKVGKGIGYTTLFPSDVESFSNSYRIVTGSGSLLGNSDVSASGSVITLVKNEGAVKLTEEGFTLPMSTYNRDDSGTVQWYAIE